jgi:hypothetical protein
VDSRVIAKYSAVIAAGLGSSNVSLLPKPMFVLMLWLIWVGTEETRLFMTNVLVILKNFF